MNPPGNPFHRAGEWFDAEFGAEPAGRAPTWKVALGLLLARGGGLVVETGCQREQNDWGAGCSTLILGRFLKTLGHGHLHSVDCSEANIQMAGRIASENGLSDLITFYIADSVVFLERFQERISLLYLDSFDWFPNEPLLSACQNHQLRELTACFDRLDERTIVLLDDNQLPNGGKTRLTKEFLRTRGWRCLLDLQQSLWVQEQGLRQNQSPGS